MRFPEIYLASASPRRHEILTQLGIPHEVLKLPPVAGEDEPRLAGESPADFVMRTARDKAHRALAHLADLGRQHLPPRPVLAADTTVILGDEILGKPVDVEDARRMLQRLPGTEHEVRSAVGLPDASRLLETVSTTKVRFARTS